VTPQFDIPAPWAGPAIAALIIAVCFLATVDWIHQENR
jgi:hypothetical protein